MNFTLFDDDQWRNHLLPLSFTRPVSEFRIGILTIREKWEKYLETEIASWKTENYLFQKFPIKLKDNTIFINGHCCPTPTLIEQIKLLLPGQGICSGESIIAVYPNTKTSSFPEKDKIQWTQTNERLTFVKHLWEIFTLNEKELKADFELLTKNKKSVLIPPTVNVVAPENIFIEEGAKLNYVTINAEKGPVYIGENAEIMEGALIRGPLALCENSTINMGAKIYGATTIGPHSKIGGEINNVIILGYSNKGHDGFLGNSLLGEWCNLGADTNSSNLKNDYSEVKLWNYPSARFLKTGQQFCGLIMGDHSKCGINTMFNSGTVIGIACNIHGSGYPRNFVPSFSNGGTQGYAIHSLAMVFNTAKKAMERRGIELRETDKKIIETIFELTKTYRKY